MDRSKLLLIAGAVLLVATVGAGGYAVMNVAEAFIAKREGFSATPYRDQAGIWTIGYGHKIKPGEHFTRITQAEGLQLLQSDMAEANAAVNSSVHVPLNQNQHGALVSLAYNIGAGAFAGSTLVRELNTGNYNIAAFLLEWDKIHVHGAPQVDQGLANRRRQELALFNTPSTVMAA